MPKKLFCLILLIWLSFFQGVSQTTDLSIVAQAQSVDGSDVSQVEIFQDFQYIITIINSGGAVSNATFEISLDSDLQNLNLGNIISQNNSGGASNASNLMLNDAVLTGTIANMPTDSSVELKIEVTAPSIVGGIAINAEIFPPQSTTDTNTTNNQSLIAIDVIDVLIDFTVTHTQVNPPEGTAISSWNNAVTYQFTITNNSAIDFPLNAFKGELTLLSDIDYGRPNVDFESISCLGATGGTECPDLSGVNTVSPLLVSATSTLFTFNTPHLFTSGGSVTFELVYTYLEPTCAYEIQPISVSSQIEIELDHDNSSSNNSNAVVTDLLESELCEVTDICVDTIQIDPDPSTVVGWNEEVTFETTICNNGPLDANVAFFLQNLSPAIDWEILSVDCSQSTGAIDCDDVSITVDELFWIGQDFVLPVGATLTITTIVVFLEPECTVTPGNNQALIRSGTNVLEADIFDSNVNNSAQSDYVMLPPTDACPSSDLSITKTQIVPELPLGQTPENPTEAGNITYEITASNLSDIDTFIELIDFTSQIGSVAYLATLVNVECVATTGAAECFAINTTNIGVPFDGVQQGDTPDIFWEIKAEDNWSLPANSSVTFQVTVFWEPNCSINAIPVGNFVEISHANSAIDNSQGNNSATVTTFFAPCVDLVVQTFPEFTQVNINQGFDWIIDITNSENSSNAVNINFQDTINEVFTVNGNPSCTVTDGNATCISNINVSGNEITATIDNMDAGSTLRIRVPVIAPSFGGAYNNIAIATPDENDNLEVSPETNTSISNVQVVAPVLTKNYDPSTIIIGEQTTLSFTVTNLPSNASQSNISFMDSFPSEITVVSPPEWLISNGCTATFIGETGNSFVGVENLEFPEGVSSCTFSVVVSSSVPGIYPNNSDNFSEQNNIDTSQANATLTVLDDNSDVDIDITKSVTPQEVSINEQVVFEISATNLGSSQGTQIEIIDLFPEDITFISANTTEGSFDANTFTWFIDVLEAGEAATLSIVAQITSSSNVLNIAELNHLDQPDRDITNNRDDAEVIVDSCLIIPNGLSPNQDGINDTFIINCIEEFSGNNIKIFNRLGVLVYEAENYLNDWDGKPNKGFPNTSERLPVGTYFYVLDLNNGMQPTIGWIYLNY